MEDEEQKRKALLLEQLEGLEGFRIWRKELVEPVLEQLDIKLASSDQMPEAVLRANVLLRYLIRDTFYGIFDKIKIANQQERETNR